MRLMGQDRTKRTIIGRKSPVSAIHVVAVCDYCGDCSVGVFGNACLNFSGVKPTRNNPTVTECATASSEFVIDESQHSLLHVPIIRWAVWLQRKRPAKLSITHKICEAP